MDGWQEAIVGLHAEKLDLTAPISLWTRVVEASGHIAELVRRDKISELAGGHELGEMFGWVLVFAERIGTTVSRAVWDKYPALCPYCYELVDDRESLAKAPASELKSVGPAGTVPFFWECRCSQFKLHNRDYPAYRREPLEPFRKRIDLKPTTIADWEEVFEGVYPNQLRLALGGHKAIGFHLLEEIAEVSDALRRGVRQDCYDELADVFSWLNTLSRFIRKDRYGSVLDDALWRHFPGICRACASGACDFTAT